jgi:hypothetical protein
MNLDGSMGLSCETSQKVLDTLFATGYDTSPRAKLKSLRITSMSFQSAGAILPTVVSLNELEHLQVLYCQHTDRLYESLSQLNLTLKSLCEETFSTPPDDGAPLKTILRSLAPLQKLRIVRDYTDQDSGDFVWSSLITHAPELRCLQLGNFLPNHERPFVNERMTFPSFQAFCSLASRLQQLSMLGPAIEQETWASDSALDAFLVSSNRSPLYLC